MRQSLSIPYMPRGARTLGQALAAHGGVGPGFNLIRLGAAVAVLVSHSFPLVGGPTPEPVRWLSSGQTDLGGSAVFVFFMISGFLVTASAERSSSPADFALKRALRIMPGLVVVVLLGAFVLGPAVTTESWSQYFADPAVGKYVANIAFAGGQGLPGVFTDMPAAHTVNGSLWTLRYEVICYAAVVVVGAAGLFERRQLLLIAMPILIVMGWWAKNRHFYALEPFYIDLPYVLRFAAYFAAGMTIYLFRDKIVLDYRLALAAVVLIGLFLRLGFYHLFFPILGGYLVAFCAMLPSWQIGFLANRDYSYGIYLFAFPMQQLAVLYGPAHAWWANIVLALPPTLLLAVLSWHLIERPALSLKPRARRPASATTITPQTSA